MDQPLVTVNILSYNRQNDLRVTLQKVFEQDYKNIEVIVVDNNSTDGTVEMVKKEFPSVQLIELKRNIGIAGWNEGFKAAKGEYVLVLDDDSYPESESIQFFIYSFKEDTQIGIVAGKIKNLRSGLYEYPGSIGRNVHSFIGCGALIRKDILLKIGMFSEKIFLYFHEMDFSLRLYDNGYKIIVSEYACINHINSKKNRNMDRAGFLDSRKVYYDIRNTIYLLLTYFNFDRVIFRILRIIIGRLYFGIRYGVLLHVLKGIASGIKAGFTLNERHLLSDSTQLFYNYGASFGGFYFWNGTYGNLRSNSTSIKLNTK